MVAALVVVAGCSFSGDPAEQTTPTPDGGDADAPASGEDAGEADAEATPLVCGSADPTGEQLVACFRFESSVDDEIGDIPAAQGVGNMVFVSGVDGQAVRLDGSSYIFSAGDAALNQMTVTIDMWVRPATIPETARVGLLDLEGVLGIFIAPGGGVRCNGRYGDVTVGTLTTGVWTHVACRHSATNGVEVFIDGEQKACANTRQDLVGGVQPVMIGANSPNGDQTFTGDLDTTRFSARALSDAELCAAAGQPSCALPAQLCP